MLHSTWLVDSIRTIHEEIRDAVVAACEDSSAADLSRVVEDSDGDGDTIYAVDRISEEILVELIERNIAPGRPSS